MSARKETLYNTYGRIYEVQLPKPDIRERKRGGEGGRERERISWCFTPSQPVRLYQRERERERVSKLVFYGQSTSAVISERERK